MGIYDRNRGVPGAKKNLWVMYTITEELRIQYGLTSRTVREPAPTNDQRMAAAHLAQRRREVRDGLWLPAGDAGPAQTLRAYGEAWLARRKVAGVKSSRNEMQRLRDYVWPTLGDKSIGDVRRKDVRALIQRFQASTLETTGKPPAPRMVHRVYEDLRTLYANAVEVDELVLVSPCSLRVKREELPKKKDADPRWRSGSVYTRDELEALLSDERIELPRRVNYALLFLTGSRVGEVCGMLWRDYDPSLEPLGRIVVATTYGGTDTKTETTREVPVHPTLASLLARWKLDGFRECMGRPPRPDDYIVPRWRHRGAGSGKSYQDAKTIWRHLQQDLKSRGFRARRVHDTRRTLITLARADGANKDILNWITHGPSSEDMQDLYTSFPWPVFCAEMSKLRISLRGAAEVIPLRRVGWSQIS